MSGREGGDEPLKVGISLEGKGIEDALLGLGSLYLVGACWRECVGQRAGGCYWRRVSGMEVGFGVQRACICTVCVCGRFRCLIWDWLYVSNRARASLVFNDRSSISTMSIHNHILYVQRVSHSCSLPNILFSQRPSSHTHN